MNSPTPLFEATRAAVMAMPMAQTLKIEFRRIEPGFVELEIPVQKSFCFRPGQLQATPVFAAADFAAVVAARTVLPPGFINATIDATLKIVAPACGSHLVARGRWSAHHACSQCAPPMCLPWTTALRPCAPRCWAPPATLT